MYWDLRTCAIPPRYKRRGRSEKEFPRTSVKMTYLVLNYMKYNYHHWYAANVAVIVCGLIYCVFLNVLQFEGNNRTGNCQPYFYQSSACRKLVSNTIATDANLTDMKQTYSNNTYDTDASLLKKVQTAESKASSGDASVLGQLSKFANGIQNLRAFDLGNLRTEVNQPGDNAQPSVLTQLKTLLDTTIVDPTMIKYVDPLTRLYGALSAAAPAPSPLPSPPPQS